MANIEIRDGDAAEKFLSASGAGTNGDPFVPVHAVPASELHLGAFGLHTDVLSGAITRPSDTTAYAAGDAISDSTSAPTAFFIDSIARINAGAGLITNVLLIDSAAQSTKADLELWLFGDSYTNNNDNAAWAPSDTDMEKLIGIIKLGINPIVGNATSGAGGNCMYQWNADPGRGALPFKCATGSKKIYFALIVRNGYTPVSAEKFTIKLGVQQD